MLGSKINISWHVLYALGQRCQRDHDRLQRSRNRCECKLDFAYLFCDFADFLPHVRGYNDAYSVDVNARITVCPLVFAFYELEHQETDCADQYSDGRY